MTDCGQVEHSDDNQGPGEEEKVHYLWHLQTIGLVGNGGSARGKWKKAIESDVDVIVAIIDNGLAREHDNLDPDRILPAIDFSTSYQGTRYNPPLIPGINEDHLNYLAQFIDPKNKPSDEKSKAIMSGLAEAANPTLRELVYDPCRIEELVNILGQRTELNSVDLSRELKEALKALCKQELNPDILIVPDPSHRFGAHGTACAGLVAGTTLFEPPADGDLATSGQNNDQTVKTKKNTSINNGDAKSPNPRAIRYYGIDPKAKILPISTLYNHEYWPVIMGLLYAYAAGADVILMPRPVMDLDETLEKLEEGESRDIEFSSDEQESPIDELRKTRFTQNGSDENRKLKYEKELFEWILNIISTKVPVIVAAGNTGRDRLEYPANLVACDAENLIVAGACTAYGTRASYSCHLPKDEAEDGATQDVLYAPSNDGEIVNFDYTRYNPLTWRGRELFSSFDSRQGVKSNDFAPFSILALDIPGEFGYGEDTRTGLDLKTQSHGDTDYTERSLYAMFGGTSAASAIIAGVASLIQRVSAEKLSGSEIKKLLGENTKDFEKAPGAKNGPGNGCPKGKNLISAKKILDYLLDYIRFYFARH